MNLKYLNIIKNLLRTISEKIKILLRAFSDKLKIYLKNTFIPYVKKFSHKTKSTFKITLDKILIFIEKYFEGKKLNLLISKINYYFLYSFSDFYKSFLRRKKNLIFIFSFLLLILLWGSYFSILYSRNSWDGVKVKKITLQPGMNLNEIAKLLLEKEVISNTFEFKLMIKLLGKENQLYAGTYYVKKGMSNLELSILFTTPDYLSLGGKGKITFPEGYRIKQMGLMLQKDFDMSQEKFITETENDSLINLLGLKGKIMNLEGFLFPDTYIVPMDADEKKMVKILFDNFLSQVYYNPEIQEYTSENPKKLLDLIILASIVQAETAIPEEYPIIAGVYINRLKRNIKLQADPTIQYILPDGPRRLMNKDYKIESPYNTYLHNGLPPGPINNPGLEAIKACMKPAEHDYLFFVAKKDKTHKFSRTYEEHLQAINEIRGN